MEREIEVRLKPFLRWAGGKTWLLKHLDKILKNIDYKNYHEPFLGGGAVFFFLKPKGKSYLSDLNGKLIETYEQIQTNVENVILKLEQYENFKEDYYKIRNLKYDNSYERAAQFIYLNQTSFNGLYRENLKGEYNVPYGFRKKEFYNESNLNSISRYLDRASFSVCDFQDSLNNIHTNDLVFLDPPYTVSHNKNGFIKYNKKLFSLEDQFRLSEFVDNIKEKGAYFILTNAAHSKIDEIFKNNKKIVLERASIIGGRNAKREKITEFIFTNI